MTTIKDLKGALETIEKQLGRPFSSHDNLMSAFVHPSYINENRSPKLESYERLEFLGDAILGHIVSHWLYLFFEKEAEGELSWMRGSLVDAKSCAHYLKALRLDHFILLSKGEAANEGKGRDTILSDVFEAVLAALFLDAGMEGVEAFFKAKLKPLIEERLQTLSKNPKMVLQSHLQKETQSLPIYEVIGEEGPQHEKRFIVQVTHQGQVLGEGTGLSKKEAQIEAARQAITKLGLK